MRALFSLSFTVLGIAASGGWIAASAQGTPHGDAKVGQMLWMRDGCYSCHGTVGEGGIAGPKLAPNPLPFSVVIYQLRTPVDVMPAYSTLILTDQDAANIYAYLGSIPPGESASEIPALKGYLRR